MRTANNRQFFIHSDQSKHKQHAQNFSFFQAREEKKPAATITTIPKINTKTLNRAFIVCTIDDFETNTTHTYSYLLFRIPNERQVCYRMIGALLHTP